MNTIADLIGNTPLVRLSFPELPDYISIYGKLEGNNPAGSVKDRPAYHMIKSALERGAIHKKTKLIEATSGNTGIALAMIAASFGMNMTLVMPKNSTQERIDTMKAFGAHVILTEAEGTIELSRIYAEQLARDEGYFMLDQFSNPDNCQAHYLTTGPEIYKDTKGAITHFVSSMGTTGTIMGTSMFLKEQNNAIKVIGVQPEKGSRIPGIRKWSDEFIPKIYNPELVDEIRIVNEENARIMTRRLASQCGVFAGMSSGGTCFTAIEIAKEQKNESLIVCILSDRGDRYLSSDLF